MKGILFIISVLIFISCATAETVVPSRDHCQIEIENLSAPITELFHTCKTVTNQEHFVRSCWLPLLEKLTIIHTTENSAFCIAKRFAFYNKMPLNSQAQFWAATQVDKIYMGCSRQAIHSARTAYRLVILFTIAVKDKARHKKLQYQLGILNKMYGEMLKHNLFCPTNNGEIS